MYVIHDLEVENLDFQFVNLWVCFTILVTEMAEMVISTWKKGLTLFQGNICQISAGQTVLVHCSGESVFKAREL